MNSRGDGFDPVAYVVSKNVHRRHLTQEQRRDLIAKVLKATPEKSNLQIAKQVKADDKTVAKVRAKLESTSDIPKLKKTKGKDGKSRPVRQKRASRKATRSLAEATPIPEVGTKPDKIIQAEPTSKATGSPTKNPSRLRDAWREVESQLSAKNNTMLKAALGNLINTATAALKTIERRSA